MRRARKQGKTRDSKMCNRALIWLLRAGLLLQNVYSLSRLMDQLVIFAMKCNSSLGECSASSLNGFAREIRRFPFLFFSLFLSHNDAHFVVVACAPLGSRPKFVENNKACAKEVRVLSHGEIYKRKGLYTRARALFLMYSSLQPCRAGINKAFDPFKSHLPRRCMLYRLPPSCSSSPLAILHVRQVFTPRRAASVLSAMCCVTCAKNRQHDT